MEKPFYIERSDTCPLCRNARCIEAYNYNNKAIGLTRYLDSHNSNDLKLYHIHYMQCKKCGNRFFPMWFDNIPYAATDSSLERFLSDFEVFKNVEP